MYNDKKVLIFGLGLNDGGLGMAEYFLKQGAKVTITDSKTKEELAEPISVLSKYKDVTYHLGEHIEKDFIENDIIVRNPGIKPDNKYLKLARDSGKEIVMEMALFHKVAPCSTIGVTGTRGKSTTTALIYEILKAGYSNKVILGGNIGKSAIREVSNLSKDDLAVLEISSFQLDGMGEAKVSPHIAVITNVYQDHINWHGSLEEYINSKKKIFLNQSDNDYLIVNLDDKVSSKFIDEAIGKVRTYSLKNKKADYFIDRKLNIYESGNKLLQLDSPILEGKHNYYNIIAAIAATRIYNIPVAIIKKVIENFEGIACRQEFVREINGVKYYNDTCATSVEAIMAMFDRFGPEYKGKIVMIAGGIDKGLDYSRIKRRMRKYLKALVLFEGTASERIDEQVGNHIDTYKYYGTMQEGVDKAKELASSGDIVILCPGGSSFNMFINEFDRGNQFVEYVNSL
jgi:UDP-N-acetylmuramoylalanine--D-glutamate ligase